MMIQSISSMQVAENSLQKLKQISAMLKVWEKPYMYIVWPWVFKWYDHELIKNIVLEAWFIPLYPLDNELTPTDDSAQTAYEIFLWNFGFINKCDLVIADVSRFRWDDTDSWSALEIWGMLFLGKPIFAYNIWSESQVMKHWWTKDKNWYNVENFGLQTNLMIHGAVKLTNWIFVFNDWMTDYFEVLKKAISSIKNHILENY